MNAEERKLIAGLFDRLRGVETAYRDPEADGFIREQVGRQPHAPYAMAQTLIVQNQTLEAAQARIAELETALDDARRGNGATPVAASPWGPRASEAMGAPAGFRGAGDQAYLLSSQPYGGPGGAPAYGAPPQAAASRGGGFLSGALQTAAGVAGGALLFSGIQSLFGGNEAHAAGDAAKAAETQPEAAADTSPGADEAGGGGWFSGLLGGEDAVGAPADDGGDNDWI